MIEENKIVKVISLINKLTKEGAITWEIVHNPSRLSLNGDESLNGFVYDATFNNQKLRLFKYNHKFYTDYDEYATTSSTRLSFIDNQRNSLWDFPEDRAIDDLYQTVRFKTSRIEDFFNSLELDEDKDDLPF